MNGKTLSRKHGDAIIRLTRKYYSAGDTDILPALRQAEENAENAGVHSAAVEILGRLAKVSQRRSLYTFEQMYAALVVLGFPVEEKPTPLGPEE